MAQGGTNGRVNDTSLAGTSVLHWYLISAIEAWVPATSSALVILGDSITDGRGSTDNENNRSVPCFPFSPSPSLFSLPCPV